MSTENDFALDTFGCLARYFLFDLLLGQILELPIASEQTYVLQNLLYPPRLLQLGRLVVLVESRYAGTPIRSLWLCKLHEQQVFQVLLATDNIFDVLGVLE